MQVCSILLRAHSPRSIQNEAARIPPLSSSFLHPKLIRTTAARRSSGNSTAVFPVATLRAHSRSSTQTKTVIIPPPSSLCPHIPPSPVTLAAQSSVIPTAVLLHLLYNGSVGGQHPGRRWRHTQCPHHCAHTIYLYYPAATLLPLPVLSKSL